VAVCSIQGSITVAELTASLSPDGESVLFSCEDGFTLVGDRNQSCLENSREFESVFDRTRCIRACPPLDNIANGTVEITGGIIARYVCDLGFTLIGSFERLCDDGTWTGSEPECIEQENTFADAPVGINPRIALATGVSDIFGPRVLITHCNASFTFNYRSSGNLRITASLLLLNIREDGTVNSSQVVAAATTDLSKPDLTFVCLGLICGNDVNISFVSIGQMKITAALNEGKAEISDLDFQDNTGCRGQSARLRRNVRSLADAEHLGLETDPLSEDLVDEPEVRDCDNSSTSGDCEFRDTACGSASLDVTLTPDDPDIEDDIVLVQLQKNRTTDNCQLTVCPDCLANSGYSLSSDSTQSNNPLIRRRRQANFIRRRGLGLCLHPGQNVEISTTRQRTIKRSDRNAVLSFSYDMDTDGLHELSVFVLCRGRSSQIHLGKSYSDNYKVTHYHARGRSGTVCLLLHRNIEELEKELGFQCNRFAINFHGAAIYRRMCISNIRYLRTNSIGKTHACSKFISGRRRPNLLML
jgi:hypothetical protein